MVAEEIAGVGGGPAGGPSALDPTGETCQVAIEQDLPGADRPIFDQDS
jgi:hypothetical protein